MTAPEAGMYHERPSSLPGSVVWRRVSTADELRVLPDGCMDLIWTNRGDLFVAGPDTRPQVFTNEPGFTYHGIRFASGVGPDVLGVSAAELVNRRVPLADIWHPGHVGTLVARLEASTEPGGLLEAIAAQRLRTMPASDPRVDEIVRLIRAGTRVGRVADRVGLSERQLHRRSLDAFGYGPKTLARILRLGRAVDMARAGTPYADVAAESGYADQAHLARDVRALTESTLTQLAG